MPATFDVAVIGAGVVGTAVARALSAFELRTVVLEAGPDVGTGTSKANTAILHTGFDAVPGSLEARLVVRGHELLSAYAEEAGIPVEKTGACLVAWNDEEVAQLPLIEEKARANGCRDLRRLSAGELYAMEPHLGPEARAGLLIPQEGIVCPFTPPLAFATEAVVNGVELRLNSRVASVGSDGSHHLLTCGSSPSSGGGPSGQSIAARWVVNAAGLQSDTIEELFGRRRFRVRPRRGELIVFDKLARRLLSHVILPVPTKTTKGVLVAPTVFGNVLLGPTATDVDDKDDRSTTREGLDFVLAKGGRILPALAGEEVTATYAGLRAATESSDYQVHFDPDQRYLCLGGIRSTGLSASLAIAEHAVELLSGPLPMTPRRERAKVRMPPVGEKMVRAHEDAALIARDPDYGRIVCHCERVTAGEIRDAIRAPVPARSLDGLRRRTRALQGRCQGFYCTDRVVSLLARETGRPPAACWESFA
jgi:glycerol-3-phosphate dehydrogenase